MPDHPGHGWKVCQHGVVMSRCRCIEGSKNLIPVDCGLTLAQHRERNHVIPISQRLLDPPQPDAMRETLRESLRDLTMIVLRAVDERGLYLTPDERDVVDLATALLLKPSRKEPT